MKTGICTIALRDRPLDEVLEVCAGAGAESVELWGRAPHLPDLGDLLAYSRIHRQLRDAGLRLAALGSYFRPDVVTVEGEIRSAPPDKPEAAPAYVLGAAVRLQAPIVRIWPGNRDYNDYRQDERAVVMRQIIEFANRASEEGLIVALERHHGTLTGSWEEASTVVAELRSRVAQPDLLGLCYQVPYPVPMTELRSRFHDDATALLPVSCHCHLQNYALVSPEPQDHRNPRSLLESGAVDYRELGAIAAAAGYEDSVMIEFVPDEREGLSAEEALARDVAFAAAL